MLNPRTSSSPKGVSLEIGPISFGIRGGMDFKRETLWPNRF